FCLVPLPCLFVTFGLLSWFLTFCLFTGLRSRLALDITVCLEMDPACLTMLCLIKLTIGSIHASHESRYRILRLPQIQRLSEHRSTMDPASRLFRLRQGNQPFEDYVTDFCEQCSLVTFNDVALKDIFCHGLNKPIRSYLPGGKIHWSLEQYIDYALRLNGSPFTVGIADEEPCNPTVPIKSENFHTPTFMSGVVHVVPNTPEPHCKMAAIPQSTHKMAAISKPAHVMSTKPETSHAKPAKPKSAHAMPAAPGPVLITSAKPQPALVTAALPESAPVMAALPEPVHKILLALNSSYVNYVPICSLFLPWD
ncbi:hypothetical protein M9458_024162, partial [Cirrhinus mrigala]